MTKTVEIMTSPLKLSIGESHYYNDTISLNIVLSRPIHRNRSSNRNSVIKGINVNINNMGKISYEFTSEQGYISRLGDEYEVSHEKIVEAITELVLDMFNDLINSINNFNRGVADDKL